MSASSDSDSDNALFAVYGPPRARFKQRVDYIQILGEDAFHLRFRISKQTLRILSDEIRAHISPATAR